MISNDSEIREVAAQDETKEGIRPQNLKGLEFESFQLPHPAGQRHQSPKIESAPTVGKLKFPRTGYSIYFNEKKAELQSSYIGVPLKVVTSFSAKCWKRMTDNEREVYFKRADVILSQYLTNKALLEEGRISEIPACAFEEYENIPPKVQVQQPKQQEKAVVAGKKSKKRETASTIKHIKTKKSKISMEKGRLRFDKNLWKALAEFQKKREQTKEEGWVTAEEGQEKQQQRSLPESPQPSESPNQPKSSPKSSESNKS